MVPDALTRRSSPDQDHLLAEFIDGSHAYVIRGSRGTAPYFVMASWSALQPHDAGASNWATRGFAGLKDCNPALLRTTGMLQSQAIDFDAQGNFEVLVSREAPAGTRNWLKIEPDCVGLLIRVVYHDRTTETAPLMRIERLDHPHPAAAARRAPEHPARQERPAGAGLSGAGALVVAGQSVQASQQHPLQPRAVPEQRRRPGPAPRLRHLDQGARRGAGAALHAAATCDYWIFQLCNLWQENFDNYEDGQGHVTKYRCALEPDGSVWVVIADTDPDIGGNWIDPGGHVHGGMSLRLILTAAPPPPGVRLPAAAGGAARPRAAPRSADARRDRQR